MSLSQDLSFAIDLARSAGKIILDHFGQVQHLTKTHATTTAEAVTDADRASQRFIVAGLRKRFPADGIIGEENDTGDAITFDAPNPAGHVWVIDPIDGTNNFIAGLPEFCVCIGMMEAGRPVLGVVYDVCRDLPYAAAAGEGAWLANTRLHALTTPMYDGSVLMLTSNLLDGNGVMPAFPNRWLSQTNWKIRILGSAALEAVHVAAGVAHGAVTVNGKLWDIAAAAAVVLEAGGTLTDLKGAPVFPFDLRRYARAKVPFLAAGPGAHATLLAEINRR